MSKTGPCARDIRLFVVLYPFVAAAVAVNLFMLGLAGQSLGLPAMTPLTALYWSIPLGIPATWLAARWVRKLIAKAESDRN
ncbi:hypothetical protein [Marimonas arenosa]|uniref:NnrT protein n=1 Tax=Marimonas arenosa TaxID=1795305 RepID=A0AAE3WFH6_9RHOB|nr:hypothetical protein [Marimonas arenosa]MDQ2091767.1 hypothetical protein [Marimonas arenosa]